MASTISAGTTSSTAIAIAGDTSGALALQTNNGTTAVTIDTSQRVGVGTTSPSVPLTVASSSDAVRINQTGGGVGLYMNNSSANDVLLRMNNNSSNFWDVRNLTSGSILTFGYNGTEQMRIDTGGNLSVGGTGANGKVSIFGQNADWNLNSNVAGSAGGTKLHIRFIGDAAVAGTVTSSGTNTTYNTSSDYRLKEDVKPMVNALDTVSLLKPCTYKWKSDGSDGQGFIAHELQAVVPDCVTGEKDAMETYKDENGVEQTRINPQGIDTSFLVATLTAAIQELNAKVDAQATTIAELQAKVG